MTPFGARNGLPDSQGSVIGASGELECHEVKGWWRDDARVKIKVAAELFPWIQFVAVTKQPQGWVEERL